MVPSTNNAGSLTNVPSANILDPLHELFTTTITSQNKAEGEMQNAFSSSNDHSINNGGVMSNEKIMALFNTPQTSVATLSGMNIRTTSNQPLNRMYRNRNNLIRWQLTQLFV